MQRIARIGAVWMLTWMLVASRQAVAQDPAAAGSTGLQATSRLVVFEAFMRPT